MTTISSILVWQKLQAHTGNAPSCTRRTDIVRKQKRSAIFAGLLCSSDAKLLGESLSPCQFLEGLICLTMNEV